MKRNRLALSITWIAVMLIVVGLISCGTQGLLKKVSITRNGGGYDILVDQGVAYMTNNDGILIYDVSNPKRPEKLGEIITGTAFGIDIHGDVVYIASENRLVIADVSDPANPAILGEYSSAGLTQQVRVDDVGTFAYLASSAGLEIVDISQSENPTRVAHLDDGGKATSVAIVGDIVYLAKHDKGLQVIDASDPTSPHTLTTVTGTHMAWDIHIQQDTLYLGCHGAGVQILDISEGRQPRVIGRYHDDDGGEGQGVWGNGSYLYVSDNYSIEVLDITDPTTPRELDSWGPTNGAHDLYVDGSTLYIAEASKGFIILEHSSE